MDIDWAIILQVLGLMGGIAAILTLFLGPMFYLGAKMDAFRAEVREEMNGFRSDMNEFRREIKDFHGKLCTIEEKIRK